MINLIKIQWQIQGGGAWTLWGGWTFKAAMFQKFCVKRIGTLRGTLAGHAPSRSANEIH